jgi:myo-inositol-1-phosphate synthase
MERDETVQQSVEQAKQALRHHASSIDYMQPVKDNPIKSISTAFLLGASIGGSSDNKVPSSLFSILLKAAGSIL